MNESGSVFEVIATYRVLICIKCQFAVVPRQVEEHLRKHHRGLSLQQRRILANEAQAAPNIAQVETEVVYPKIGQPPIDHLPVFFDGLRCLGQDDEGQDCQYVCRTKYGMQEHCKQRHGWINSQKRGGNVRAKSTGLTDGPWKSNCACQRFFKVGKWQRYFEVRADDARSEDESSTDHQYNFFRSQEEDIAQAERDAAEDGNRVQGFDEHRSTVVPWLRETGIVDHLRGLKKDDIKAAITIPSAEENSKLRRIIDATESMLREAHSWCFDGTECMLTWPCRVVLSRFQSSQVESFGKIRPFDPYKEPNTLKTYFKVAKQVLVYFDRVAAGDDYFFSAEFEECIRPEDNVEPTEEQVEVWHAACLLAKHEIPVEYEEKHKQLQSRLLEFWMLLICQDTGPRRYRSPLLSFCAMLSIKPSTQSWLEPGNFNSSLSAIIWVVQLLVFYDSARKERDRQGKTLAHVKKYCESYLQQTVETPMGEILRWRLLLFRVSKDTVGDHEAFWDESEQVLTYEDTELHMDQIPTLLESEYRDCRRLLYDDLMFGIKDVSFMHAWALRDGANVDTVGWNFTRHRDNEPLLKGTGRTLLAAIERSDQLCRLFLTDTGNPSRGYAWRENAIASYEATVQELLKRLCVLIHISGGQPVRESEFFAMTWRNTQRRRSITICHERVMIHVKYHKGQQQTGRYKENVRLLAHPVGELLLDYIVYVLPLRQTFLRQQTPKAILSPFLWEKDGKVWAEGQLSQCLENASVRARIPRLHVSSWRQITVAIVKTKFASQIGMFEANLDDEDAEEVEDDIRIMTRQRNHKTQTVNRAYANQTGASFGNVWDGLIRMALRASTLWQDFLGVDTILKSKKRGHVEEESRLSKRVAIGVYRPRKPWLGDALLEGVRKLYGNETTVWKSAEQEQALTTIMSWTEQVVVILPTGAGKSLLFMLPCTLPGAGITILVVPLVALRGDLLRRLREHRIDHIEWLPGERRESSLVLVTAEAASKKDFMKYARTLVTRQKLDRIVVDECHLTVTAASYRQSIVDLTYIRTLRTQFVYLTATLPPSMQAEFEERNFLVRPRMIRASSNRPNIFYMVRKAEPGNGTLLQQAAVEAQDAWTHSGLFDKKRDKIILYVRTRDEARELADLLTCGSYTARSGTAAEKGEIIAKWIASTDKPYLVATSAFAEGFDYPHVRLVINVNEPESIVLFAQESGRAGRDGEKAYSLVMLPPTWNPQGGEESASATAKLPATQDQGLARQREKKAMHKYLDGRQCYRTSLSEHLDSRVQRRWCMSDDVPCDVCRTCHEDPIGPLETEESRTTINTGFTGSVAIQEALQRDLLTLARYREDLIAVRGSCLLCRVIGQRWDHEFASCHQRHDVFEQRKRARQRHESKGRQWLQPYSACFWCLNPQSVCQRADPETARQTRVCQERDIVLPLCYGIFLSAQGHEWLQEKFDRAFESIESFFDWLGEESRFGGRQAIQAVRVAAESLSDFRLE